MKGIVTMVLQVLMLAIVSCQTARPMERISLTTDGGFTGRGIGGITIEGRKVTATGSGKPCSGTLTDAEAAQLEKTRFEASTAAGPGKPDQIHYVLQVGDRTASWYGEEPPEGAAALFHLLWKIRQRVVS